MIHQLKLGESTSMIIDSKDFFSKEKLAVATAEIYNFSVEGKQYWCDSIIKTNANGFNNIMIVINNFFSKKKVALRLNGIDTKCFTLCGCLDENDNIGFRIGTFSQVAITHSGILSFFANDVAGFYHNNRGTITLTIKRIL
jgi:hypothetical protein